jgi:hypothetical protein
MPGHLKGGAPVSVECPNTKTGARSQRQGGGDCHHDRRFRAEQKINRTPRNSP